MKFRKTSPTSGDCTATYDVSEYKADTVGEFIEEVVKENPNEWGEIIIHVKGRGFLLSNVRCKYRYGKVIEPIDKEWNEKKILSVSASGGWSCMYYLLRVKEEGGETA